MSKQRVVRILLVLLTATLAARGARAQPPAGAHLALESLPPAHIHSPEGPGPPEELGATHTLASLQSLALGNNPTIRQAAAEVEAQRGSAYQAGLFPNPTAGYASDQIGIEGTAGELQGAYVSQEIVTGGKLRLSRAKYLQRARVAETNLFAQRQRVLNDTAILFYRALAAQRLVDIHRELLANADDRALTHREMLNLGQTNRPGLLRAEIDREMRQLDLNNAENELHRIWRELVATIGVPCLPPARLEGELESNCGPLTWDDAVAHVLSGSPELAAAWQRIRHDRLAVERERVQPVPNLWFDANAGQNFETNNAVCGVNLGLTIPIFDQNRGTIQQAQADLARSRADVRRIELELRAKLAHEFRDYETAWQHVHIYHSAIIPKAEQALRDLRASYDARRVAWPEVVEAQETLLVARAEYTRRLGAYREADIAIHGMLLRGALAAPKGPMDNGHIDSVPKPR